MNSHTILKYILVFLSISFIFTINIRPTNWYSLLWLDTSVADPEILVGSGSDLNIKIKNPSKIDLFLQYQLTKVKIQYWWWKLGKVRMVFRVWDPDPLFSSMIRIRAKSTRNYNPAWYCISKMSCPILYRKLLKQNR